MFKIAAAVLFAHGTVATEHDPEEIRRQIAETPITCSSSLRLQNVESQIYLNSIKSWLGTGSQEQVLTAVKTADSYDSMFQIKEGHGLEPCQTGQSIKCGDNIRLEHINTGKNLHSAYGHKSALSRRQEVCGYGVDGDGDTGDNWILTCSDKSAGEQFYGGDQFHLKHDDTGEFLYTDERQDFNYQNCGQRCPIMNHYEVSTTKKRLSTGRWGVSHGAFFPVLEKAENQEEITQN